ncbi:histidine kinase [Luteococcus sp. OSA5]|uniref:sensor histidine kinase n=1 Tax=Luteococcus sp. OSA5 TaxID=3401630 RepID=UPI003B439A21
MAFVGALAVLVARPLAAATLRRTGRKATRTGWWDGRSLAWLAVTLTIRSSVAATAGLTIIGALVAMVSPALAYNGDRVDIGPWHIDALPSAIGAALCGAVLLAAVSLLAPAVATADQHLMDAVLIGDRDRLESQLEHTSSSRTRLVNAFDLERRRIERDLHDGIQPELLGISMTLGIALTTMGENDPARHLVATAQQQSLDTLEDLRRFVRGIHPQVLDDHGLTAALAELAATLPLIVHIDDQLPDRLDAGTEAALYYAGAELLTNAAKHAQAVECRVTLRTRTHEAPAQAGWR